MSTDSTILDRLYTRLHGWGHYLCTLFVELPVILRVLLIYGLSRLWGVAVFSMVGRQQLWGTSNLLAPGTPGGTGRSPTEATPLNYLRI